MNTQNRNATPDDFWHEDEATVRAWLAEYLHHLSPAKALDVKFAFDNSDEINAYSAKDEQHYDIRINKGLLESLLFDIEHLRRNDISSLRKRGRRF